MGLNDFIKIGTRIKECRQEKGFKQKDIANQLGIPVSTFANYENNHREPGSDLLERIADVLKISIGKLIGFDEFEGFIQYLESIDYIVKTEIDEALDSHVENMQDNGIIVGQSKIIDNATYITTLKKGDIETTFTQEEFEQLKNEVRKSIDYQVWQKNQNK